MGKEIIAPAAWSGGAPRRRQSAAQRQSADRVAEAEHCGRRGCAGRLIGFLGLGRFKLEYPPFSAGGR